MKNLLRKAKHILERKLKFYRRIGLKNKSAAIISNNCTGGYVYQYFGLTYNLPTAGLFFTGADYVKLCENTAHYFSHELQFISPEESKNKERLKNTNRWGEYPIARCDDIEIYFMHYHSEEEASAKWRRRISRVNYENMVFLLAESELSTATDIHSFCELSAPYKVCLTYHDYGDKTIFSSRVAEMDAPSWLPEIVLSSVNWKNVLNRAYN